MSELLNEVEPVVFDKDLGALYELGVRREEGGVEVRLLWSEIGNTVLLDVMKDEGREYKGQVPSDQALESLYHPSLYMPEAEASGIFGRAA
jgi:hypothetical protein